MPAGLDIGAQSPAEIALSILATIVAVRRGSHAAARPGPRVPAAAASAVPARDRSDLRDDVAAVASTPSVEHEGETVYSAARDARPHSPRSTPARSPPSDPRARGDGRGGRRAPRPRPRHRDARPAARGGRLLVDKGLATSMFLSLRLPQPLLLEGEAGRRQDRGCEGARARPLDAARPSAVLRGIDAAEALYEWNYPRQLLSIRLADSSGTPSREEDLFGPDYLIRRPCSAPSSTQARAAVLLIDEIDRPTTTSRHSCSSSRGRERTIPSSARSSRPIRRHRPHLEPDARPPRRRQAALPLPLDRVPDTRARGRDRAPPREGVVRILAVQFANTVSRMRASDVQSRRGSQAIDWVAALHFPGVERLDTAPPDSTLGSMLKHNEDQEVIRAAAGQLVRVDDLSRRSGSRRSSLDLPRLVGGLEPPPARAGVPVTPPASPSSRSRLALIARRPPAAAAGPPARCS